jgi:hypothetical protein
MVVTIVGIERHQSRRLSRKSLGRFLDPAGTAPANPPRKVDLTTSDDPEPEMNSYPASEQRISEVERGRICNAILPMPGGKTLCPGDSILFALAYSDPGQETCYVKGGDSVCVSLTQVTELGGTDPATGQALFRLSWKPPGQSDSSGTAAERHVKPRGSHAKA